MANRVKRLVNETYKEMQALNLTRRSFGALMLGALPASLLMAGCSDDAVSAITGSGTLRAGVRADVAGFGYLNEGTGNYYGMEIDLVEKLASRLGYGDIEFVTILPENRKEMLLDGQVDLIAACYSIAETRLENFDFSPAYYDDRVIAVVQNSSLIEGIDDMRGLTFGTMSGANAAPLLSTKLYEDGFTSGEVVTANEDNSDVSFDTWHLLQFPSYQELSDALEDGTVDAMVLDGAIAQTYMDDKRHVIDGFVVAEQSYGIATQKDSELSAPVAEAVQGMLDDGTIDALVDKWD